jgi:phosphoribosylformimino-5-aminoimidazole carboxamide ribotide isomerase
MDLRSFVIPAIDIKEGRLVRLYKGEFSKLKEYDKDLIETATWFNDMGFKRLHLVDLDGAEGGKPRNLDKVISIRKVFSREIEFGGGIRSFEAARSILEEGIDYVVIGTLALKEPAEFERILEHYPNRVILSIDAKYGKVAVGGWKEESSLTPRELASRYEEKPIWGYLYTIIERDGSLEGVDIKPYEEIKNAVDKPLLASGGVSSLEDIKRLTAVVDGVVVERLYMRGE